MVHDERKFIKQFEQPCRNMYIQLQDSFNDIQSSSRCRMYKEINQVHKPEVSTLTKKVCTSFTKFKLSSHKLIVERGCWMISKLDYKLRKCTLCNSGDIEVKYHVTLVREQFADARKKYFKKYFYRRPSVW